MFTPLPWIGSTMKAAIVRDDKRLFESGQIVEWDSGAIGQQAGSKPSRKFASALSESAPLVSPWKA